MSPLSIARNTSDLIAALMCLRNTQTAPADTSSTMELQQTRNGWTLAHSVVPTVFLPPFFTAAVVWLAT